MLNKEAVAGYLGASGQALIDLDDNKVGWEDFVGTLLVYVAEVLMAVTVGDDLPPFPDALRAGTTDKIGGAARASLKVANAMLGFARFQVSGKAAIVIKYANQALTNLLDGSPVPPAPAALLK